MRILDGYIGWKRFGLCISQCQPWPLKNLLEGNTGDKMIPHLIRLSFCVQNYCSMNILDA